MRLAVALGLFVAGVSFCAAASPTQAVAKVPVRTVGGASGATGGLFGATSPRGMAVNQSGTGGASAGDLYVVDGGNNRVEQFSSTGTFIRAWGQDVDSTTAGTGFEVCPATDVCKAGLTTPATANGGMMNSPQGVAIDQASGAVYVTDQGNRRVQKFSATGTFQWAAGWDVTVGGVTTFETCVVAASCKTAAVAGGGAGQFAAAVGHPAVDPITGNVYVADITNRRIQKFTAGGAFVSAFGWGVVDGSSVLQNCIATCQAGVGGSGLGQFAATGSPSRVSVDSAGAIYAVDPLNFRVQKFSAAGTGPVSFAPGLLTGTKATDAPSDVVVDPVNDDVYVVKANGSPPERQVLQLDSSGALIDSHGVGAGLPAVNGLALAHAGGDIYLSATTASPAGTGTNEIYVLNAPAVPPTVTLGATTAVTSFGANFSGTVNPNGYWTGYHFEYSADDGATWRKQPLDADVNVGNGVTGVSVNQTVTGLAANTTYQVRLVATKYNNAGTAETAPVTFTTPAAPPSVTTPSASHPQPGDTSITLRGSINPNNSPTHYRFEYGTTVEYGTSIPNPDRSTTGGGSTVSVTERVSGLAPGMLYHVRLVAYNDCGQVESTDATFSIPVASPTSGRDYELVTPADSLAYDVVAPRTEGRVLNRYANTAPSAARSSSLDGTVIAYQLSVNGTLPGMAADGDNLDPVMSTRTESAWTWRAPLGSKTPCPSPHKPVVAWDLAATGTATILGASCQIDQLGISPVDALGQPLDQTATSTVDTSFPSLYVVRLNDDNVTYVSGKWDALGPITTFGTSATSSYAGGSPDLSTMYLTSSGVLSPGAPAGNGTLYRVSASGPAALNRQYDGTLAAFTVSNLNAPNAISETGDTATFTASGSATATSNGNMAAGDTNTVADVYQITGDQTTWMSESAFTGTGQTPQARTFVGASSNGRRVFFTTAEKMVGNGVATGDLDTAVDLYEYDADASPHLSLVSVADATCPSPSPCNANASNVGAANTSGVKIVGVSDDGSHAYFITGDVLSTVDSDGQQSLYTRDVDTGTTTYIAPAGSAATNATNGNDASTAGANAGSLASANVASRPFKASADGTTAAFWLASDYSLPAGRGGADVDGVRDLYVWTKDEGVRRVRQGRVPDANTTDVPSMGCITDEDQGVGGTGFAPPTCRAMSTDGSLVFFQTTDPLVDADVNTATDVYAYHVSTGDIDLISAGDTDSTSTYVDTDVAGKNVFFSTSETLDPSRDTDGGHFDIYDARLGNDIIPPLVADEDPCPDPLAGRCQGEPSPLPTLFAPGVADEQGGVVAGAPEFTVSAVSAAARKAFAATGKLNLAVRVSDPGTVSAKATALLARRTVMVASASQVARTGSTVRLALKLSKAARSALSSTGKLTVKLAVTYSKAAAVQNATLKLTHAKPKAKKAKKKAKKAKKKAKKAKPKAKKRLVKSALDKAVVRRAFAHANATMSR